MKTVILGRTGLKVSVLGLGTGGHSKIGMGSGQPESHGARVVRTALDEGINFIDSSEIYNTEAAVGLGIQGYNRDRFVLATKTVPRIQGRIKTASEIEQSLHASLSRLRVDMVDIYMVHTVSVDDYDRVERDIYPVLQRFREKGALRFIGITEDFVSDCKHRMLSRAVRSGCWDVVMAGFNYLNQGAAKTVLPQAIEKDIGVLDMFAIRHGLVSQLRLQPIVERLIAQGVIDKSAIDPLRPLQFLFDDAGVADFSEAGYRFCLAQPGIHVVLTGTGSEDHLRQNIAAVCKGPLDQRSVRHLRAIFRNVVDESAEGPW